MPITFGGDVPTNTERVQTKSHTLNRALRDVLGNTGWPLRSLVELYGPKGCIAGDMFVGYCIQDIDGNRQNKKGGTLKHLYERFNHLPTHGKGYYQRESTKDSKFYIQSVDEAGMIFLNEIADVVYSGCKETWKVVLDSGDELVCTPDHELWASQDLVPPTYIQLENLNVGDWLFVHDGTHLKVDEKRKGKIGYKECTVKYHPYGVPKTVNGCKYYRIRYSHLVYEAEMNGVSVDEFRHLLNTLTPQAIDEGLSFVNTYKFDIHHWDEDSRNDVPDNLVKLTKEEHLKLHAHKTQAKFSRRIVQPHKIVSIETYSIQDVYDVKCYAPFNNFVANRVVVHNCGKTSLSLSVLGDIARQSNKGVSILDFEIQSNETVAGILEHSGFDGNVHYIQQQPKERPEDTVERFCDRMFDKGKTEYTFKNPDVGLFDSIGGFHPAAEVEGKIGDANMGKKAFEMGQISRRLIRSLQLSENPGTIIMTNHEHMPFQSIGFAPQPETSGGVSKKYMSQIRIRLTDAYIKKEVWKDAAFSGSVKFDGAWLVEGKVNENRFGISDQKFWCWMVGGEGIHAGLTAMMECLILGKAESSAKSLSETSKITLDGVDYGKLGKIIRDRNDDEMFKPFRNALKVIDTESNEGE